MSLTGIAAPDLSGPAQQRLLQATSVLPEATRLLAAFAGLGAATVAFGLSSNFVFALPLLGWPIYPAAAVTAAWGVYLVLWSIRTMRGQMAPAARTTALLSGASLICLLTVIHAVWLTPEVRLNLTVVSLGALQLIMLSALGYLRRTERPGSAGGADADQPSAGRLLLALFAASVLVAAVATPGLAATTAGDFAVPHGEHAETPNFVHLEHQDH